METIQLPASEEVAEHERHQAAGSVAVRAELDEAWWAEYVDNMPQTD